MNATRQRILAAARRAGVETQLRAVQRALASGEEKRNRRDDEHLRLLLAFGLREDDSCVDVGANLGTILEHMVAYAPRGRHVAFEPLPELAADLAARFPQVDVRAAAVADVPGERVFTRVRSAHTRSGFGVEGPDGDVERFTVPVQSLDASLPDGFVPAVVKIDVEGAENAVVAGALETIRRHRPVVVFEHGGDGGAASAELHDLLTGAAGLRVLDLDGGGPLDRGAFVARVAAGTHWNFVARV